MSCQLNKGLPPGADGHFLELLKRIRPILRSSRFQASGQNFIRESNECWAIINFQKSRWSSQEEKTFYINVAAVPKRWLSFCNKPVDKAPPYFACEWRWRAEEFGPNPEIKEWTIRDESTLQNTFDYLEPFFHDFLIPAVLRMLTESGLLAMQDTWSNYPQLRARTVMYAARGDIQELKNVLDEFINQFGGTRVASSVKPHLQMLREKFPPVMKAVEDALIKPEVELAERP